MIGFYDYTVILTYISLLSAGVGIAVTLSGAGHPYLGTFFLLFCGFCDAFDGKVARTKPNRTTIEMNYGIQIDSLSDIVAFGVFPAMIGISMIDRSTMIQSFLTDYKGTQIGLVVKLALYAVLILYILAALIRLAYFNVTEEERQAKEGGTRKTYEGLPVTSASLIFPLVMLLQYVTKSDITLVYIGATVIVGFAFLLKFKVKKPGLNGILLMVGIGAVEFFLLLIYRMMNKGM